MIEDEPVGITCECGETRPVAERDPERLHVKCPECSADQKWEWFKSFAKNGYLTNGSSITWTIPALTTYTTNTVVYDTANLSLSNV